MRLPCYATFRCLLYSRRYIQPMIQHTYVFTNYAIYRKRNFPDTPPLAVVIGTFIRVLRRFNILALLNFSKLTCKTLLYNSGT